MRKWKDIKIGEILNGDEVTQLHPIHSAEVYKIKYGKLFERHEIILSGDHLLKCNIKHFKKDLKNFIHEKFKDDLINKIIDVHCIGGDEQKVFDYYTNGGDFKELNCSLIEVPIEFDSKIISKNEVWLTVEEINYFSHYGKLLFSNGYGPFSILYNGKKECRCISTKSGNYTLNGLSHHNSVSLRNVINHCISHGMATGLIDIKQTEFTHYKGMKNVVGVANSIREAVELLRIARQVMYKRNKIMAEHEITDIADYKPKNPTNKIWISGREFKDSDMLQVRIDGEEKTISAKELLNLVEGKG